MSVCPLVMNNSENDYSFSRYFGRRYVGRLDGVSAYTLLPRVGFLLTDSLRESWNTRAGSYVKWARQSRNIGDGFYRSSYPLRQWLWLTSIVGRMALEWALAKLHLGLFAHAIFYFSLTPKTRGLKNTSCCLPILVLSGENAPTMAFLLIFLALWIDALWNRSLSSRNAPAASSIFV